MAYLQAFRSLVQPARRSNRATVDAVADIFAERFADTPACADAIERTRRSVLPVLDTVERDSASEQLAAKVIVALAVEARSDGQALAHALLEAERADGISAFRVGVRVLGDPELLELPLDSLIELCVSIMLGVAPIDELSLWRRRATGSPTVLHSGSRRPSQSAVERAAIALDEQLDELVAPETAIIRCWHRPIAVAVWTSTTGGDAEANVLADRIATLLGPAFERSSLVESNLERASALVSSAERRLTRLSFDLHDGPLQDVALMSARVAELRRRLEAVLPDGTTGDEARASLEDLAGLIEFLDNDLRDLASSLDAPVLVRQPFADVLDAIVRKFTARSSIEVELVVDGEFDTLSESQRIALARVVQEALTNVGDHSAANSVRIGVAAGLRRVDATIEDDGVGFDVEEALRSAGRSSRMGLLGMVERIRLLGGDCRIESTPGQGTRIALTMTRWQHATQAPASDSALA